MKSQGIGKFAILVFAVSSFLSIGAWAQTTQDGPGPSEQPSAPMEIGQGQSQDAAPPDQQSAGQQYPNQPNAGQPADQSPDQSNDAQPTEAQPGGPSGEGPAKTDQGVARVSLIHGDVSTQRGDSGDWSAAALNQPVMGGDKVSTGQNSRTELQLDFANVLRLGPNSKANIAGLTQKNIQIQLGEGLLSYSVSKDSEAEPEIDTPNVSVHPAHHDGVFRVEVRPDGDTIVIVRQGEAQIATPQGSTEVRSGEMATIRGNADSAQYRISSAPDRDDWDRWNSDRDHMIHDASSWRHTNRYYTGAQDLDASGQWRHVDDYGDVWYPNEPSDWAPYRNGNWVYQPYYGWTWVGYEPWGWAPYHYGRWLYAGGGWGWWPGPAYIGYRPFWSPAYVSFWGWGGGFGFGLGFGGWGGFGWLPLGPCDWFHPWWGGYGGRFGWVGRGWGYNRFGGFGPLHSGTRFSNVANFHNANIGRAMSTVNAGRFGAGRVSAMAASRTQLGGARMMAGNLPVVPSRASLSASGRAASPSTMRNSGSQRFFGTHNNMARPASFTQQTASLRQSMQQSHVGAVPAGGRSNTSFSSASRGTNSRGTMSSGSMDRPSAGTPSNREMGNNAGNRSSINQNSNVGRTNESSSIANRGGERPFTPPTNSNRPAESSSSGFSRPSQSSSGNQNGFRPFTPPSHSQVSGGETNGSSVRGGSSNYWNRTAPSSSMSSRGYSGSYGQGSSRPQLDMHQPIVRSPSYGGGYGGYRGSPSYGGSRPSYGGSRGVPSYGGGGHAPSYGGGGRAPSGGGGGHYSGGGGHSSGGGGGHSSGGGHGGGGLDVELM